MSANLTPRSKAEQEFFDRQAAILAKLPEELRAPISWYAWEKGHAYGYDCVIEHLNGLVAALEEPCRKLADRLKGAL